MNFIRKSTCGRWFCGEKYEVGRVIRKKYDFTQMHGRCATKYQLIFMISLCLTRCKILLL